MESSEDIDFFFFLNFIFLGPHFKDKLLFVMELDKYIKNYKYLFYFNYYSKYVLINNTFCKKSLAKKNFAGCSRTPPKYIIFIRQSTPSAKKFGSIPCLGLSSLFCLLVGNPIVYSMKMYFSTRFWISSRFWGGRYRVFKPPMFQVKLQNTWE